MGIYLVYSRDDGGWYAEVWATRTGKTIFTTEIYQTKAEAEKAARDWIERGT